MFYCPDCGRRNAEVRGEDCDGCADVAHVANQEYLYATGEGRNELLGRNEPTPDW